ncbi:hypothetical protein B0A48_05704 [Cryoendolithus antarcticus]|uniref:Uncharacterized protein n=1 Tax=Cryoendolithus antarcticus TaxID=1507870 RepID=A0A1V8TC09_9PEZI|nr:hypothetical protein B0A48_05704 [Cryoendolithus antarcticus]
MSSLRDQLPGTLEPLIVNAPMGGIAHASLALAVHQAGGFGFIGAAIDLDSADKQVSIAAESLKVTDEGLLPIGIGFLAFAVPVDRVANLVRARKPAVVWLSMPKSIDDFAPWTKAIREASPKTRVWLQIGSVATALAVANSCRPDAICLQGSDAGGHGCEQGAGVISLVPEVYDAFAAETIDIPLLAAGGIVNGRGVAAALVLGATGVVLGTRFLAARETNLHQNYRAAILAARDGGVVTTRSKLFDNLPGKNIWPGYIDGRSLIVESYRDHVAGVDISEIRRLHKEAVAADDRGYASEGKGRAAMWAGTGVGLVTAEQSAGDIVEEIRRDALAALNKVHARL